MNPIKKGLMIWLFFNYDNLPWQGNDNAHTQFHPRRLFAGDFYLAILLILIDDEIWPRDLNYDVKKNIMKVDSWIKSRINHYILSND